MIGGGKHSSLLWHGNNYCRNKFYSTDPCLGSLSLSNSHLGATLSHPIFLTQTSTVWENPAFSLPAVDTSGGNVHIHYIQHHLKKNNHFKKKIKEHLFIIFIYYLLLYLLFYYNSSKNNLHVCKITKTSETRLLNLADQQTATEYDKALQLLLYFAWLLGLFLHVVLSKDSRKSRATVTVFTLACWILILQVVLLWWSPVLFELKM